jgi:hypothetical protein
MDSYRAEGYGLLSITTFLHLLGNCYNHQVPPTEIWCDNMAVVNTVNRLVVRNRPEFPNETLQPSWNLIQAICATINLHSLHHVKGHQDNPSNENPTIEDLDARYWFPSVHREPVHSKSPPSYIADQKGSKSLNDIHSTEASAVGGCSVED